MAARRRVLSRTSMSTTTGRGGHCWSARSTGQVGPAVAAPTTPIPTSGSSPGRARYGRTPAQVLLRWSLQHDVIVIPKSTHRDRIWENAQIFDFELSGADMRELDALDQTGGTADA